MGDSLLRPILFIVVAACGCREAPSRVTLENPLRPLPIELEIGGRAAGVVGDTGVEVEWTVGEAIVAFYDLGCGRERISLSTIAHPSVAAWNPIPWIDVAVDNRDGYATTLQVGAMSATVAQDTTARVRVPAASCEAGARVRIGERELGTLPLADASKPVISALLDVRGGRCYRLLGGESPEGEVLLGRSVYVVPRIDDFGSPGSVAPTGRFVLNDELCVPAQTETPARVVPTVANKKKKAIAPRGAKDPVGDAVEALTARVNACAVSSMAGNTWSVQIAAKVVVNLGGQLMEAEVVVTPPSAESEKLRACVMRLIRAAKFPRNDVPVTTVKKNWRVQMVP